MIVALAILTVYSRQDFLTINCKSNHECSGAFLHLYLYMYEYLIFNG